MTRLRLLVALTAFSGLVSPALAQPQPAPLPLPPAVPDPQDKPFPGTLSVSVDATDTAHHIMSIHETVPVPKEAIQKGEMILCIPCGSREIILLPALLNSLAA